MRNTPLFKLFFFFCTMVAVNSINAQVNITSNEAFEGRINRAGEVNEWIVELTDDCTLTYSVFSSTMEVHSGVVRVDDGVETKIFPPNRSGYLRGSGWVSNKAGVELKLQSKNVLPSGKYRIWVTGYFKGIGPYSLTVQEPKLTSSKAALEITGNQKQQSKTPLPNSGVKSLAELNTEVAALREELKSLRKELLEEIRKLKERR